MIEFKNVFFSYGEKQILNNFSLSICDNDRVCLFGKSGTGKTTTLRLLLGLEKAQDGEIINTLKPSVVFQEDRLLPFKTVYDNIKMFSDKEEKEIDLILKKLGISDCKNKYPSQLSGGISRRATLARALCIDAEVYIFDEPFTALDDANARAAANLINEITKDKAIVLISHNVADAQRLNCKVINL